MNWLVKAFRLVRRSLDRGSRGSVTHYSQGQPAQLGQPSTRDVSVTPSQKREIVMKSPTLSAAMNTVIDYVSPVPVCVKHTDASQKPDKKEADYIYDFLKRPNKSLTQKQFLESLYRDLFVLGYAAVEIERDSRSKPANMHVLDSGRIQVDYDQHGNILGYSMLDINQRPIIGKDGKHTWVPSDLIFFQRDTSSDSVYPLSRLDMLYVCAVIENLMLAFVGEKFTAGNVPYGVLSLGDISDQELQIAIAKWNEQARSNHRIILTGSRGTMTWTEFGYALKDMNVSELLREVERKIMAIVGVTDNELGQASDVNKANGYNLSFTFKQRSINPLLVEFCQTFSRRFLWDELGLKHLELSYDEIDSRDELIAGQINELNFRNGFWSINEVRNSQGRPSIDGGDVHVVVIGGVIVPVAKLADGYTPAQAFGQPPAEQTPGTKAAERKPAGNSPQKPRGAVQASRSVGVRGEDY